VNHSAWIAHQAKYLESEAMTVLMLFLNLPQNPKSQAIVTRMALVGATAVHIAEYVL